MTSSGCLQTVGGDRIFFQSYAQVSQGDNALLQAFWRIPVPDFRRRKTTQERHHAIQAGRIGDDTFKAEVVIRPQILLHILNQGYPCLWTDSDMVWLENPLPFLPDIDNPETVSPRLLNPNVGEAPFGSACRFPGILIHSTGMYVVSTVL